MNYFHPWVYNESYKVYTENLNSFTLNQLSITTFDLARINKNLRFL